ncbi:aminomethyltransferase, mitochondrial-like [Amphiura filiformis]|uniref:aminomethyltransferase, mitochondrial-like n=1 Tax=Amphiura filiformis TaxID=82378 RepID=UPI003B210BB3
MPILLGPRNMATTLVKSLKFGMRTQSGGAAAVCYHQQRRYLRQDHDHLKKTPLYDFHLSHGGKMVPFSGWAMPVQYKEGLVTEHLHCRSEAVIFDVSHMLQSRIDGKDRIKLAELLTVADVQNMKENTGTLSLILNGGGGIIDDVIVTKTDLDYIYVVSNAGCAMKVQSHVEMAIDNAKARGISATFKPMPDKALLALQGPAMSKVLQPGVKTDLTQLTFMKTGVMEVYGIPECRVTRCGYTGEDGVEISVPADRAVELADRLMNAPEAKVKLAGLGARDSLRLEAGLCLYGNDIDDDTDPVEAVLGWTIGKERRINMDFPAAKTILNLMKTHPAKKRVGILSKGPPSRAQTNIYNEQGDKVGQVTSGCPSPSLKGNIAMGYVGIADTKPGTRLLLEVRGKRIPGTVAKLPFVPHNYYTPKKSKK